MNARRVIRLGVLALLAAAAPQQAEAYRYRTCEGKNIVWEDKSPRFRAAKVSFPENDPFRTALTTVRDRIDQNPSKFRYDLSLGESSVGYANNESEIWASDDDDLLGDLPAVAKTRYKCLKAFGKVFTEILEVDILFDSRLPWTPTRTKTAWTSYGGDGRPFRSAAMHEMGHGIGLLHSNTQYNIMGSDPTHVHASGSRTRAYLGENAADGAVFLYGTASGDIEDVSVSHWKYGGKDDEYSVHERTQMFDFSGDVLPSVNDPIDGRRYLVDKGQTIQVEFTYENNGKSDQEPSLAFYLSGNDTITTGDLQIATGSLTLKRNSVYTTKTTLKIPVFVPSIDLYLGAIVDWDKEISEFSGANNATYIPIRVNPGPEI